MSQTREPQNLMEQLKESTRSMHDSAESSKFQAYLANGALPIETYVDYLEQLFLVHRRLEESICSNAELKDILDRKELQLPFLEKDLEQFQRATDKIKARAATQRLLDKISESAVSSPSSLLGMHYVLLGSKHGGKFIARNCQESYKLAEGKGVLYFDPYGPNFMPVWKNFKDTMNARSFSQAESSAICKGAAEMFRSVAEIGDELMPTLSGKEKGA